MDRKTKILNTIFWGTILLSLVITFYKTVIKQDFVIINYFTDEENELQESTSDLSGDIPETVEDINSGL